MTTTKLRYSTDLQRFGPKSAGHSSIGAPCSKCSKPFAEGDYTALVPMSKRELTPSVAVVEATEQHWSCAVTKDEELVTTVLLDDEHHTDYDWLDVFAAGERAGTLLVRKGMGEAIAQRLIPSPPKVEKPVAPPAPFGDWRSHLRYALDFDPDPNQPAPIEEKRRALRAVDEIDGERALGIVTDMLHKWSSTLEIGLRLARATPAPLTIEQRTTLANLEEVVRRTSVAYLAVLADRARVLS